jgi:nicotinamidase-related amidase
MINFHSSALLLIEFQHEWLSEEGKLNHLLSDKEQFSLSLMNAEKIINHARESKMKIIHSGLSFTQNYKELGDANHGLRALIKTNKTFLENSNASCFISPFVPQDDEFIVQGRLGASAFAGSNLDTYLRNNGIQTLFMMGYALHVCVESTLRAAHDLGYDSIIMEDACSGFNQNQKTYFLENTIHHFGSHIKTDDFIHLLTRK